MKNIQIFAFLYASAYTKENNDEKLLFFPRKIISSGKNRLIFFIYFLYIFLNTKKNEFEK
jgi:hypothetical protein